MEKRGWQDSQSRTEDTMAFNSDQSREEVESTAQLHVLAVDDSITDRRVIEKILKNSCYKVTTVESVTSALEFLGLGDDHNIVYDSEVNMIITDYSMPGMTGYDLLKKVKESKLKEIPVVVMSSENLSSRRRRCLDEGAEDFIVKPVKVSDVRRLRNYMGRVN